MFDVFKNAWRIDDLRRKILYTFMILIICRIGSSIPVPYLDPSKLTEMISSGGNLLGYIDLLTGGAFSQATLFALSIQPYINASIIIQLLTIAIPALERLAKEGEVGKKKMNAITRYTTVGIGLGLSIAYYFLLRSQGAVQYTTGFSGAMAAVVIVLCFAAGSMAVMWLGDRITEKGVGNGISMILFVGILSRLPAGLGTLWAYLQIAAQGYTQYYFLVPLVVALFGAVIYFIVVMTTGERRIAVQYAKRVVGRKMYGGNASFIPIKVTMSGVLPIIFAGAFLGIPGTIKAFVDPNAASGFGKFLSFFDYNSYVYAALYFVLIIAFSYFYVTVQYDPTEIANNLRKNNGAIPGIRPGQPTVEFIARILSKITFVGALFLGVVAVLPIIFSNLSGMSGLAIGGTSVIIVVGVALETSKALESQMMMRHYRGFLE